MFGVTELDVRFQGWIIPLSLARTAERMSLEDATVCCSDFCRCIIPEVGQDARKQIEQLVSPAQFHGQSCSGWHLLRFLR